MGTLESLLRSAHKKKLYEDRYWYILLHYEKGAFGTRSLIDDPEFFLSPNGKYSPQEELDACIKTFFRENVTKDDFPVCQFIARYTWLKDELGIDRTAIPVFDCDAVNQVNPKSATIVFPTYYMNNPASMFGHTLLNIETDYANKLLTRSVNYSAFTNETNGFLFALKGLFGFYEGYYSVLPYYKKIQQYSDISQRDIWEYRLNLTVPELERMVRHIRELENIYSDYYFFDENCSYNLLYLLESARPSVNLTDEFGFWAVPIDTIKAAENAGMIDSFEFRPSKASKIRCEIFHLGKSGETLSLEIIHGEQAPEAVLSEDFKPREQIIILDLVTDYIGYRYVKKEIEREQYQKTLLSALTLRSKLGKREETYSPEPPPQPGTEHGSRRFTSGFGVDNDESFIEMGIRPAFSDLLDTDIGYHQGTQIEFLNTQFRYYPKERKGGVDHFDLVDIISISPRDRFFKPLSWKVSTGIYREIMADGKEASVYRLNTGGGLSYFSEVLGVTYLFAEPEFQFSEQLEKDYALGGGISAGIVREIAGWWKAHLSAREIFFEAGDVHRSGEIKLIQNFRLTRNNHVRIEAVREKTFDLYNSAAKMSWCYFF